MLVKTTIIVLAVLFISLSPHSRALGNDDNLRVITEDYPPLNYLDGENLTGASVDIVRAIMTRLNLTINIEVRPWKRGINYIDTQPGAMLFSTTRTEKRENLYKWVGPLAEKRTGLFAMENSGITIETLDDAKLYRIGVQNGGVGMEYLEDLGFEILEPSTKPSSNMKQLIGGRIDMWYASNATVMGNAKTLHISLEDIIEVYVDKTSFMYIAFNRETPDSVIEAWQGAYDTLYDEGSIEQIFAAHDLSFLYPSR